MKLLFSNISDFLQIKSTFFIYDTNFLGCVLRLLNNLKILINNFFYYCLKFCQKILQKSSFWTVLMIKALVTW